MPKFKSIKIPNSSGFTLVELLIAIIIVGLVTGVVITSSAAIQRTARDSQRTADLRTVQSALQQYYADQNFYPDNNLNSPLNLSTSTTITSATGNPSPPASVKTYTTSIPKDPNSNTSTPYCYSAFVSVADTTTDCNNQSSSTTKCNYYELCANLEDNPSSPATCSCGASYDLKFTPL